MPSGSFIRLASVSLLVLPITCGSASAQVPTAPPAPAGPWTGSISAGVALTGGNTDTSSVNASYDLTYDPKTKNVVKSDALFLRAKKDGDLTVNRFGLNARDQYTLAPRVFTYGQLQYLRDTFKAIDYLIAPTGGIGYKVLDSSRTAFTVDGGAGGVWEKNPGLDVKTSGAATASERLTRKLSDTATFDEQIAGLWKTADLGDALYTVGTSLAAGVTSKTQLKIELLDTYKGKPPTPATKRNDVALIFSLGYKL
jgi:putative salt-induced outer membrane protein YdiY